MPFHLLFTSFFIPSFLWGFHFNFFFISSIYTSRMGANSTHEHSLNSLLLQHIQNQDSSIHSLQCSLLESTVFGSNYSHAFPFLTYGCLIFCVCLEKAATTTTTKRSELYVVVFGTALRPVSFLPSLLRWFFIVMFSVQHFLYIIFFLCAHLFSSFISLE